MFGFKKRKAQEDMRYRTRLMLFMTPQEIRKFHDDPFYQGQILRKEILIENDSKFAGDLIEKNKIHMAFHNKMFLSFMTIVAIMILINIVT